MNKIKEVVFGQCNGISKGSYWSDFHSSINLSVFEKIQKLRDINCDFVFYSTSTVVDDDVANAASSISTYSWGPFLVKTILNERVEIFNKWDHDFSEKSTKWSKHKVSFFIRISSPVETLLNLISNNLTYYWIKDVFFINWDISQNALIETLQIVLKSQ